MPIILYIYIEFSRGHIFTQTKLQKTHTRKQFIGFGLIN